MGTPQPLRRWPRAAIRTRRQGGTTVATTRQGGTTVATTRQGGTAVATRRLVNGLIHTFGVSVVSANEAQFHSDSYRRHNARRLEHLASLRLAVAHATVLEVGAGVGDHS